MCRMRHGLSISNKKAPRLPDEYGKTSPISISETSRTAKLSSTSCPLTSPYLWIHRRWESSPSREPEMATRSLSHEVRKSRVERAMVCMVPARALRRNLRQRVSRQDLSPPFQVQRMPGRHRLLRLQPRVVPQRGKRGGQPGQHQPWEPSIGRL